MPVIERKVVSGVTYERYVQPATRLHTGGNESLRQFPAPEGLDGSFAFVVTIDTDAHTVRGSAYVWADDDMGADNDDTIIFPVGTTAGSWLKIFTAPV